MKSMLRKIGELFALWIVIATALFLFAWLVVPKLIGEPDDAPIAIPTRPA